MFIRTPSLMSGSQPMGCSESFFQRTKMSKALAGEDRFQTLLQLDGRG